jgi:predicted O-methyltransferase YrrM
MEINFYTLEYTKQAVKDIQLLKAAKLDIKADFIFIDGSHEENDVYFDLYYYYQLLKEGGYLWGDDWPWEAVKSDVNKFVYNNELNDKFSLLNNGVHWNIRK